MVIITTFTGADLDKGKLIGYCKSITNIRVDGPLTNETSVLIASSSLRSDKFTAAMKLRLPIVKPDWIEYLFRNPTVDPDSEESISFMKTCLINEITGWTVSTTGFTAAEQALIVDRIKHLGGKYIPSLPSSATCLIVKDLSVDSAKLKAARKWKMEIHDRSWLFDEARECGFLIMESDMNYSIFAQQSSMSMSQARPSQNLLSRHDPSSIPALQRITSNPKSHDDTDNIKNAATTNFLEEDFGACNDGNVQNDGDGSEYHDDPLYLDGLSIFVGEGFSDALMTRLRKIVRDGGGNLMAQAISGQSVTERDAQKLTEDMHVVNYKWLSDCFDKKRRIDPEQYPVSRDPPAKRPEIKANPLKQKNTTIIHPAPVVAKNASSSKSKAQEAGRSEIGTLKPKKSFKQDDQLIFQGNVYTVVGFPKKENEIISKVIGDFGGNVVLLSRMEEMLHSNDLYPEDGFIVKPFKSPQPSDIVKNASDYSVFGKVQVVTEFFIEKCIQDLMLHSPLNLCLFRPSTKEFPIPEFEKVVMGATGLLEEDKQWAERIVLVLGGTLTQAFSRSNTHLLYNPSSDMTGAKILKAREWGTPLVDIDWLYSCVEQGRLVPLQSAESRRKELSLRTTKATKLLHKNNLKTAKLYTEKVFKGVAMAASKIIPPSDQIHRERENVHPPQDLVPHEKVIPTAASKAEEAEYSHLFKSTIEDALFRLTNAVTREEPAVPVKRFLIQETHDDRDGAKRVKLASPAQKEKPNQVVYLDADAKHEQMRLLQALGPARAKFFMFSGVLADARPQLATAIENLKGKVLEADMWDNQCTHLINSNRIVKTEKFLAACASCSWILRADYVQKSQEMGKWLDESQFVIQNHEFATSAMHWKQIHITTGKKPFSGWKCALSIEKSRRPGFVRLLRAGDAVIVDSVDEFTDECENGFFFYDKINDKELADIQTRHPQIKSRESSTIVEYLLSAGKRHI